MTIVINRWRPDTCDCVINFVWDDSLPAEQRVHTYVTPQEAALARPDLFEMDAIGTVTVKHSGDIMTETICKHHATQKGPDLYEVLRSETSRKEDVKDRIVGLFTPEVLNRYVGSHAEVLDDMVAIIPLPRSLARRFVSETLKTMSPEEAKDLATAILERFAWEYDDARVLHVKAPLLEDEHKKSLQAAADRAHGVGKVVFH